MTERKIPPGEPDNKVPQEPSKDETSASAEEVPVERNTPSTNDPQNDQPQPDDPDLLEKIRWAKEWIKQNPKAAAALGLTAGGLTVVAAPALLTGPVLSFMGFGSGGVVGGSIAAGIQAAIGNVVAGSWFATVTSAAMGGYGVPVVAAVGQGIGAGAALVGGAYATKELRKEKEGEEADEAKDEGGEVPPNDPKNDDDDEVGTEKEKASRWRQSGLGRRDFDDESTLLDDSDSENSNEDWHP
ncbi:unnamed protein product [Sordaria macrospora k-hell]|uniref:WGS project CABT00000000 data, contig 2.2 n=2 Tax=Sordaria macrospora TaxID=5147 RepID=F7VMA8_SORMK|nr:uncharacterized protein SMAC_01112 [Sordaria macrospora k-hell]KAH7630520.1 hypothetical protein B0T09DRAFT_337918 [Sordaria sp. MPI-SDFR-AT-0083]CCC07088.1 unnamed protein product [Sordaria macrospora k-hell]